ncbi:MAG: hypothetical protein ACQEV0_06300 [Bacillota bacterium]
MNGIKIAEKQGQLPVAPLEASIPSLTVRIQRHIPRFFDQALAFPGSKPFCQ